jgi:putative transposase
VKKSRYTDRQILNILKLAEAGSPVPDLCREYGMSSATFYKWRAKYGGMDASLMAREHLAASRGNVGADWRKSHEWCHLLAL